MMHRRTYYRLHARDMRSLLGMFRLPGRILMLWQLQISRLADRIVCWHGDLSALVAGRAVLVGFPQDGVERHRYPSPGARVGSMETHPKNLRSYR